MKKVAIFAPSPISGSGGVARIYNFAQALSQNSYECHVFVFDSGHKTPTDLSADAANFYNASGYICHSADELPAGFFDLAIATRWDTAPLVQRVHSVHKAYLIQDFEAYFNPVGDGSVLAENSYLMGLQPLTYGRWLALKLRNEFGNSPYYFEFASNISEFRCTVPMIDRLEENPKVVFVYQGDKTRRCPRLGIEALGIVKHMRPDVDLYFVGSDQAPSLWYDFHNVGNLTIQQLNELYNECHVGVSLSSSNPSCNPFDMMSSGLPAVDLYRENNLFDTPSKGVLLAHQTPESVAEAILHLLNRPDELMARSQFGLQFMAGRSQVQEVTSFLAAVEAMLSDQAQGASEASLTSMLYDRPPVVAEVNRNSFTDAYIVNQWRPVHKTIALPFDSAERYYPTDELGIGREPQIRERKLKPAERMVRDYFAKLPLYSRFARRMASRFGVDPRLTLRLFDPDYYLSCNPDVVAAGIDPLRHFVRHGAAEGRVPSPHFDAAWYGEHHPESASLGMSPILYYLIHGSAMNQSPSQWFDSVWYLHRNHDVCASGLHPLLHYIESGEMEGRDPSERFSLSWYRTNYPDVAQANLSPLLHFLNHGKGEGRLPLPPSSAYGKEDWQQAGREIDGRTESLFDWQPVNADFEPDQIREVCDIFEGKQPDRQVSFDVWSTIIHRRCHPDEIKLRSARFLFLHGGDDINDGFCSPVALMKARMRAENASAPNGDFEYRFDDAVGGWLRDVLIPSCGQERRAELARMILAHELEAEKESIEIDENAARAIRCLPRAPIFVSDFYMASPFIERLLDSVGVGGYFVRGYVSCDTYENKRSGLLFRKVLNDFSLTPDQLTHVGDNPIADLERPKSLGINAAPYVSQADEARHAWYSEAFHAYCGEDNSRHERRLLALIAQQASQVPTHYQSEGAALYQAGCKIGLLAFGYCLNIMQDAIKRGAKEVVFFAREGILFKEIYDILAECRPFTCVVPPSKLLYVSRRATFAASLQKYNSTEFMRLWTMYWQQSPLAFAASLNLDQGVAAAAAEKVGLVPEEKVSAPWADARFTAFLDEPDFKAYATEQLDRQRTMLRRYIDQEISTDQPEILIADIGWRGTIQDNISHLLGKPIHGHYLALFNYLNEQPALSSKAAWLSDANHQGEYALPDKVAPLEMIFNGPGGSTIGYQETENGAIEPIREIFAGEESVVEALEPCRAGMRAVIPSLARYVQLHGLIAENFVGLNRKLASDLIQTPPTVIADVFGRLEHNETFGVGALEAMQGHSFAEVTRSPVGASLHHALSSWLGSRWPEGLVRQTVVKAWWQDAGMKQKASAPLAISKNMSPGIVKATGSRLAVYVPEPLGESGGFRTIFNLVRKLYDIGFNAEIYLESSGPQPHVIEDYLGNTPATIYQKWSSHRPAAVALATIANSAKYVQSQVTADLRSYLVQDAEALFQPMGDNYISAENSYALGLSHITVGNWLTHLINMNYASSACPAGFGVDTAIYRLESGISREKAVCVLYQPEKPRRGNEMALEAIALLKRQHPDVRVYIYGSDSAPSANFDFEHLGLIRDLSQINQLYNRCSAGLCLSLSNPSRIPFEMAAAGCRSVDVYRYNNLLDYNDAIGILAYQSPASIAYALSQLLVENTQGSAAAAVAIADHTLDWEGDAMVAHILSNLNGDTLDHWDVKPTYNRAPIIASNEDNAAVRQFCLQQWDAANRSVR
ncbi:hypothetical protein [Sphingobium fuliginis]|jgi:predicted HAD superfamily hydrolase/glycosyltransferase involved in cell wall biosynthesis|uniref:rhamnosyltransferase WsaF family glycosyltransferase n=1 Tax=Sphingobium fuliginis (strain ATCC 27551) TaxID=336203 RepID=UPI0037C7499E